MAPVLPYVLGATAILGMVNRNTAQANVNTAQEAEHQRVLDEQQARLAEIPSWEQEQASILQSYSLDPRGGGSGIRLDPSSPVVQEALRRRNARIASIKAGNAVSNAGWDVQKAQRNVYPSQADPLGLLFNVFQRVTSPVGTTSTGNIANPSQQWWGGGVDF